MNEQILKYISKNGKKWKINFIIFNESNSNFLPFVYTKICYKTTSELKFPFKQLSTYLHFYRFFPDILKGSFPKVANKKAYYFSTKDKNTERGNELEIGFLDSIKDDKQNILQGNINNNFVDNSPSKIFYIIIKEVKNDIEIRSKEESSKIFYFQKMKENEKEDKKKDKKEKNSFSNSNSNRNQSIPKDMKHKNVLELYKYINNMLAEKKKRSVKYFTSVNQFLINNKKINIYKLKLTEILKIINICLTSEELKNENAKYKNEKIWEKIFIQLEKLTNKETSDEEYKKELLLFFQNLTNIDLYNLLNNLKQVKDLIKKEVYECMFFKYFAITLRGRDITYPFENGKYFETLKEKYEKKEEDLLGEEPVDTLKYGKEHEFAEKEKKEIIEYRKNAVKEEKKIKSYIFNLKSFLSKKDTDEKHLSNEQVKQTNDELKEKEIDKEKIIEKEQYEKEDVKNKGNKPVIQYIQKNNMEGNEKDVRMIRKWLSLLSYFPNNSENFLKIKDYLNKMFRKHVDELIAINYFANTVDCLTNQINSKSIQTIIMAYENKLPLMKAYDYSYSLIILSRFLILNHHIFNKIIDRAIIDPITQFENEKYFMRFIKSIDNYPLINSYGSINAEDTCSFQNNINDMYNLTFAIFLKKLSFKLQDYSLNNLLYISECLGKVIFMSSTQNQSLHVFINKLRYFIDQSVDLLFVNNHTLIRLFKISSSFSFVPESYVFIMDNVNRRNDNRRFSIPLIKNNNKNTLKNKCTTVIKYSNSCTNLAINTEFLDSESVKDDKENNVNSSNINTNLKEENTKNEKKKKKSISFQLDYEKKPFNCKKQEENKNKINENNKNIEQTKSIEHKSIEHKSIEHKSIEYKSKNTKLNRFYLNYPILKKYDTIRIYSKTVEYYNNMLNYSNNQNKNNGKNIDMIIKNEKNKFLLKNLVLLLCAKFEKTLDEIVTKEMINTAKDKDKDKEIIPLTKERLINEIKLMNEKNTYKIHLNNTLEKNMFCYNKDNRLYIEYLIFFDLNMLSEIIKFTSVSINTNNYSYELIKPIKNRLNEIFNICTLNQKKNDNENNKEEQTNEEMKKIKNIHTFQLYKFYCAVKNLSPSYLLSFFDVLIKITPKISIVNIEKNMEFLNKKKFHKSEHFKKFEDIYDENITVPFVVSLLQALKILISSNIFESNKIIHEYVNLVIQYAYYVLFYCYYNQGINKKKKEKKKETFSGIGVNESEEKEHVNVNVNANTKKPTFSFSVNNSISKKTVEKEEEEEEEKQMKEFRSDTKNSNEKKEKYFIEQTENIDDIIEIKPLPPLKKEESENKKFESLRNYNRIESKETLDSDNVSVKNLIKKKKYNNFCFLEKLYQDGICNIYVCLSTILYFINGNENMSNEVKHLIYLETAYLNLFSELKLMKYLSDKDIFFLFKSPLTSKLEEKFDGIITILKNVNQKRMKKKAFDFTFSLEYQHEFLSLPSLTAFFLCKAKLLVTCGNANNNSERADKTLQLCKLLISEYEFLASYLKELFQHTKDNTTTDTSKDIHTRDMTGKIENTEEFGRKKNNIYNVEGKELNINKRGEESYKFLNKFSQKFQKIRNKYSNVSYFVFNKNVNNCFNTGNNDESIHFRQAINSMFFGSHEIETLYDLQDCLLKTIKDIRMSQINFTLNHKFINILPIHNNILSYLEELTNAIKECLYTAFLSQPYVHKNPKNYCTKSLVNYYINRCRVIEEGNARDEFSNKFNYELKKQKFITSIM